MGQYSRGYLNQLRNCHTKPPFWGFFAYNKRVPNKFNDFNLMTTKSLFSQNLNLCDDFLGFEWHQSHSNNMFDVYRRANDLDPELAIYHYGNDRFEVRTMIYTEVGCIVGDQIDLGRFDNIQDAEDCAEDYLKDLLLDLGV